ncbi:MAG: DegV family protein [Oscillospiraceae bacterium]|nr:DegV family protein [Oscillospiraceae bacterium]
MKIAIATDTNSGITAMEGEKLGVFVLAMPVNLEETIHYEGIDITSEQLYDAMRQHRDVSTSQPSPGQLMELWDGILAKGYDEIVYIPMSSGLSGSCQSAALFAQDYDGRVQVVDNHRISVTQKESVISALRLVEQGYDAGQIRDFLEKHAYDASIYITVDSMEYLKKGGRVTPAAATLATVLNLKPVLTIQGDKLDAFAKVRGMKLAESKMIEAIHQDRAERFKDVPESRLLIETAGTLENGELAEHWRQQVQAEFPFAKVSYANLPCSIACHLGMNSVAAVIMTEEVQRAD